MKRANDVLLTCAIESGAGGVQGVFGDLVHWLEQHNRTVHVVCAAPLSQVPTRMRPDARGRPAWYLPMPAVARGNLLTSAAALLVLVPYATVRLARLIRRHHIDVINCHYLSPRFIHLAMAARLTGVPLVVSVHGADVDSYAVAGWLDRVLLRAVVGAARRIVACSAALARQTADAFPDARDKVMWAHNGLDPARFVPTPMAIELPQRFLLCVCRHVRKKGIDSLLHAFARVAPEVPGLALVLVGDGPLRGSHHALAVSLGIEQRVVFLGDITRSEVSSVVAQCLQFVLPSREEPFGVALLEAAHHGKPIVCTKVGGVPEIVTHGVDCLMVEPRDASGMASAILRLLRDPDLAARLGRQARATLEARFLWKDRIRDYLRIFDEADSQDPAPASARGSEPSTTGRHLASSPMTDQVDHGLS